MYFFILFKFNKYTHLEIYIMYIKDKTQLYYYLSVCAYVYANMTNTFINRA